ncbi:hypothetical protein [Methanomethylophilus alvi]|uniref:hypothetical protein n=1 Tax=Methanomethylophilus alvi TaxID=1291540 RepID=UPI0037DC76F4
MAIELDWIDVIKIIITGASVLFLYLFRRKIVKIVTDVMIGGDSSKYDGKSVSDILDDINVRLGEVVG